ncbi:MAG: hypothetical protein HGA90_03590, partial [Alphaproteobacteria bacterium]|nr:hypothetical protein [Alphaproteobacteria bacterium]
MAAPEIILHRGDIPPDLSFGSCVAVDTESLGLNFARDRLCLVQLSAGDGKAHLVQFMPGSYEAPNLKKLLADPNVLKLFHYARADLGMIAHYLGVMPKPVYCTKIASVLARTFTDKHSLKDLTKDLLGIELAKEQQTSDWGAVDQLPGDYVTRVATAINAGIDMVMVPYDYKLFIDTLSKAVERGDVSQARIDEAVGRILRVKF